MMMMHQITKSSLHFSPTKDELLVAQILLDLPIIIGENRFKWGFKKRRSNLDEDSPPAAVDDAGSPVTPLSFESDEKKARRAFKINSRERAMEEYNESIENLTKRKEFYKVEIEKITGFYEKLNAYNSELKAMKQEVLNSRLKKKEAEKEQEKSVGIGMMGFTQIQPQIQPSIYHHHHHPQQQQQRRQQPLVIYPMAQNFQHSLGPITAQFYSPYNGFGSFHGVGPDLNFYAGGAFGFDPSRPLIEKRVRFANARRLRKGIMKTKSMRRACGIQL